MGTALSRARTAALVALVLALGACASTQCEPPRERRAAHDMSAMIATGASPTDPRSRMLGEYAAHLADAQRRLALAPAQQAAWNAYAAKAQALMADQLRPPATAEQGDALRAIDRRVDIVRNRYAALEDIADAARVLYRQLDDRQKQLADRLLPATVPALYSGLVDRPAVRPPEARVQAREVPERRGDPRGMPR